ncbi:5'-deoxynucleotidase [Lachnoclostridium phytofermentans]|uniref:Metal dependent phosphohydrolase n=1 Tax=Lachnoclostridium phytofermentans (strain ATCC 700394 / DSM 18823 / ISDg) TaxID=357809 RepID=A9KS17_LACP7|nr:5'-deoxynucleotidase [Lachnoclostridium phytofermentans]ABX40648.1 metal dependent phosphohydrolase [Lachnoclostridium phytofermentans ISDg]
MEYHFYAMMSRMKYIERWALMRNAISENISEHSLEVSMLAHALAVIGKKRFHKELNAEKAALIGLYHDATEIITGDMPTPIKYYNRDILGAFQKIEENAANQLLGMLPEDIREEYHSIFFPEEAESYLWKLVKGADKLSALIKCMEEEKTGNTEFVKAKASIEEALEKMELPEVELFMKEYLPSYAKSLDELR